MEAKSKMVSQLIRVFENHYCIRIKFESEGESTPEGSGLHACFVVDRSGSMAGGPIRDAKGALVSFITKMEKLSVPVTVIAFNSACEEYDSATKGYQGLREWAEKITGSGGTLFKYVFDSMQKKFLKEHLDNTFVMFLSDGQDNEGLQKLVPYMEKFKNTIATNNFTSSIHTIGFSDDHDAKLLTALTTYGTKAGTFQYLERDGRIPVAVNNATEFLYQSSMWGQYMGAGKEPIKLEISDDDKNAKMHYGIVFLDENEIGEAKVELYCKGKKQDYQLDLQRTDDIELEDRVHIFTSFTSNTVLKILEERQKKKIGKEAVPALLDMVGKMDKQLDELIASIKKFRSLQRKQMMPFCLQAKDLVAQFYIVLKEDVNTELSNLKIAQLNRLAYQNILQRSLLKKINKRVGENAGMLQEIDQEITKILAGMDFKAMDEKYKDTRESYGHCLISYRDWLDALQDGDCFCLTFDAQRAEGGIMGQHGATAGTLVKGLPDEVITGILPLYINEEHWKVARLRIKPLLAWTIAQDVLAYETKQLTVLPFVLLAKAAITQVSEYKKKQFQLILDTCSAIYRDNKGLILPELKAQLEGYVTKPEMRTADVISNNRVFLLQLYVACKAGDLDEKAVLAILPYVIEEEIRRNGPKLDVDLHSFYLKVLEIDTATYVDPIVQAFHSELDAEKQKDTVSQSEKFKLLLKAQNIAIQEEQKAGAVAGAVASAEEVKAVAKKAESGEIVVDTSKLGEKAVKMIERYNGIFKQADWALAQTVGLLPVYGVKPYETIVDMGLNTPAKQLAFVVQTATQKVNADRREAIQKGLFVNSFDEGQACGLIKRLYNETVVLERNNQKSKILAEIQASSAFASAPLFASTKDIYDAAGLLHGVLRGTPLFSSLHKALRAPGCPLVIEKAKMLTSGQFMGVKLIMDGMKSEKELKNGFVTWMAKKKYAYKIWFPNKTQGTLEQWKEAFPHLKEYLEGQDKRAKGEFVPYHKPKKNVVDPRHWELSKKAAPAAVAKKQKKAHGKSKK